jgi:hypothetical protein
LISSQGRASAPPKTGISSDTVRVLLRSTRLHSPTFDCYVAFFSGGFFRPESPLDQRSCDCATKF